LGLTNSGGVGLGDLGPLGEIAATGLPADISGLVKSTTDVANRNIGDQATATQAQFGPQGDRFSSDAYRGVGLVRERGAQDLNQTLMQLAYGAAEQAAGRRVQGSELLMNYGASARQSALAPILASLGIQPPDVQPGAVSQAIAAATPSLAYGLAAKPPAAAAPAAPVTGGAASTGNFKGTKPGKG
jgi:hypothetical protein